MRFMLLMIPKGYDKAPRHAVPSAEAVDAMMKYNESLQKAGVLVALDGLHPPSTGTRVVFSGGKHMVTDGPFIETREALGGYWIINVKSKAEAVEWATRCPGDDCTIEVRQVFEMSEFPDDVQKVAAKYPELREQAERRGQRP
ncbi:MAG TPA: YciI family protein [bacterium]|nr:YciI family protein [bacterium]